MRAITKKEQNSVNGGVGIPAGGMVFVGCLISVSIYYLMSSDTYPDNTSYVNNASCYVTDFLKLPK